MQHLNKIGIQVPDLNRDFFPYRVHSGMFVVSLPLSTNALWRDVKPVSQAEGPEQVCPIAYSEKCMFDSFDSFDFFDS